ncbi:MAG: hypothetical protein ACXVBX_15970 [Flavisolibacter sp.]
MPLYLKGGYQLFAGQLTSIPVLWAKPGGAFTPEQLEQHQRQLEQIFHRPVVFVFPLLDAWVRQRLVQRRIGFMQIDKQLYIPQLFLELSDVALRSSIRTEIKEKLSPPAQASVIFQLLKGSLEKKSFGQIANLLAYSPMTVTRLTRELANQALIEIVGTKEKQIRFLHQGRALWEAAKSFLSSPVKEEWFVDELSEELKKWSWQAGDTALEYYTLLSAGRIPTSAIFQEQFAIIKRDSKVRLNKDHGNYKIQSWSYDPALLGIWPNADPLSVYLSVITREDERVESALEELINSISW